MAKEINGVPFTLGNSKLPKTTAIFNMGTATGCPSRTLGLCQCPDKCYAMKAERQYKDTLAFRERQAGVFGFMSAKQIADAIIAGSTKKCPIKQFRFSESGDFRDQAAVNKMTAICAILKEAKIKCYGYTARKDLKFNKLMEVANVQGSGFMVSNNFKFIPKGGSTEGCDKVCKGDCTKCSLCWKATGLVIGVNQH